MGPMDIVILLALFVLLGIALRSVYNRRRSGGCSCDAAGGCAGCSMSKITSNSMAESKE